LILNLPCAFSMTMSLIHLRLRVTTCAKFISLIWSKSKNQCVSFSCFFFFNIKSNLKAIFLLITNFLDLDFYKTIALINYIRHKTSLNTCYACGKSFLQLSEMTQHMETDQCFTKIPNLEDPFWKDPKYLFPTYENDPLLTGFDGESDDDY